MNKLFALSLFIGNVAMSTAQINASADTGFDFRLPIGYTLGYGLCFYVVRRRDNYRTDEPIILSLMCCLTGIGMAALNRIDPALALTQLYWLWIGLIAFTSCLYIP